MAIETRLCEWCSKPYLRPTHHHKQKYCSPPCRDKAARSFKKARLHAATRPAHGNCEFCGSPFIWNGAGTRKRFCSRKCNARHYGRPRNERHTHCLQCNTPIPTVPPRKYCSKRCSSTAYWENNKDRKREHGRRFWNKNKDKANAKRRARAAARRAAKAARRMRVIEISQRYQAQQGAGGVA